MRNTVEMIRKVGWFRLEWSFASRQEYTEILYTLVFSFSFVLQLRLMRSELSVEEVIKQRTLKVKF